MCCGRAYDTLLIRRLEQQRPMDVGVCIVGFGFAGADLHAPLVQGTPGLRLVCIVTSKSTEVVQQKLGTAVRCYPSLAAAHAACGTDFGLVVVATPNKTHADVALEAARFGKRVVVDKPFATSVAEADAMLQAAGSLLSCFQNRRWDSDFLTVERLVSTERALGDVVLYRSQWLRWRPEIKDNWRWRADEPAAGLLYDLGPHMLHQTLVLFGMPSAVTAVTAKQRAGAEADDYFSVTLTYASRPRLICSLEAGVLFHSSSMGERTFMVYGDKGSFEKCAGIDAQEGFLRAGKGPRSDGWGIEPAAQAGVLKLVGEEPRVVATEHGNWGAHYAAMAAAIVSGSALPIGAAEARNVMLMVEAAAGSAASGRTVSLGQK